MSSLPRISVLMPVYNGERFLRQAIASIINQSFTDFEFLIIDDGSVDATVSIIQSFSDKRIRFFARSHKGLVAQLNFGIDAARAPFIARFDGDDIADPRRLEIQLKFLQNNSAVGVVSSSYDVIDERGHVTLTKHLPVTDTQIRELLPCHCVVCHACTTMRKDLLSTLGGYAADDYPAEDYGLWLRLLPHTQFYNFEKPLLQARRFSTEINPSKQREQRIRHLRISMKFLQAQSDAASTIAEKARIKFAMACSHYYSGSMLDAQRILRELLGAEPFKGLYWRYYLPTLAGDRVWQWLRRHDITSSITNLLRYRGHGKKMLAP